MFEGKVILVTGGSSGIGKATLQRFSTLKPKALYNLDVKNPDNTDLGTFLKCNVADADQVRRQVQSIIDTEGQIDVLFANAGVHIIGDIEETSDEELDRIIDINLKGVWHVIRATLPAMRSKKSGAIVITGSDQSLVGRPKSAAYGLTKGALGQLTKSLAIDYAKDGIRINCVCPAAIDTPLCRESIQEWARRFGGNVEQMIEAEHRLQPIGRMGTPEDVAALVTFLSSPDARNMTGALVSTDGGFVADRKSVV